MPELNTELFKKIHKQITEHPEAHDQGSWEGKRPACGTTRCVAGWALHFATDGAEVFHRNEYSVVDAFSPEVEALAERLGVRMGSLHPGQIARPLLGLTGQEAAGLFYADDEQALTLVTLAATGRGIEFNDMATRLADPEDESDLVEPEEDDGE